MWHLHSLELLLHQKLQECPASQEHQHKPHQGHTPHDFIWKTVNCFNSHTCHTQHSEHPLERSTRGREIMCKALAPQTGDPAPQLLWAVMPQAPHLSQQSWCSPFHSPALLKNWEQEEAAEKCCYCKKLSRFLPEFFMHPTNHRSACQTQPQHRPTHLAVQGMLTPGHLGAASPPEHTDIPQSTWLLHR